MSNRNDVGMKFIREVLFSNNRLSYYDYYIKLAKKNGYIVTSYIDYLENYKDTDKKVIILRHDIDHTPVKARIMFEVEKKNNVKATYYFRWSTIDYDLAKEMNDSGFEVGLHYETLATYCLKNNINSINNEVIEKAKEELKKEIKEFKEKTGINIKTIANHGHPKNVEIGASNNVLLENEIYKNFGIVSEAYDKDFYKNVNTHIMDNNILTNYGFSYKSNPIDSILRGDKVIVFLAHPQHWKDDFGTRVKMAIKILLHKYTTSTTREFKRINDKALNKENNN